MRRTNDRIYNLQYIKKQLHGDIFNILVRSKVFAHLSCSAKSKQPFYQFTGFYDLIKKEKPDHAMQFLLAFQRLIKANYLYVVVVDKINHHIQFILQEDYYKLREEEKMDFSLVPAEIVLNRQNNN